MFSKKNYYDSLKNQTKFLIDFFKSQIDGKQFAFYNFTINNNVTIKIGSLQRPKIWNKIRKKNDFVPKIHMFSLIVTRGAVALR